MIVILTIEFAEHKSMSELIPCTIDAAVHEECHLTLLGRTVGLNAIRDLSEDDRQLLELRCGHEFSDADSTICHHHMRAYVTQYETQQKTC